MANQNPDPNNDPNKFVGIPISELVKAPLEAVIDSQKKMAQSAYEFMTEIGFNDEGKTRMVEFDLQKSIEGSTEPQTMKVQVPFVGLVPIPNLLIEGVQIDFQTEGTAIETSPELSGTDEDACGDVNFKFGSFGFGTVNVGGKVVSIGENTDSSDRSAKHKVNVSELNSQQLEDLTKIIELLTEHLESVPRENE